MGQLRLPAGTQAGLRLVCTDAFGQSFCLISYGVVRKGWFVASRRDAACLRDTGPLPLRKGEWRTLLNFLKQCRFWDLPATLPDRPDVTTEDGEWLELSVREAGRYHRIHRFIWREPGLEQLLSYCRHISTLFPTPAEAPLASAPDVPAGPPAGASELG